MITVTEKPIVSNTFHMLKRDILRKLVIKAEELLYAVNKFGNSSNKHPMGLFQNRGTCLFDRGA